LRFRFGRVIARPESNEDSTPNRNGRNPLQPGANDDTRRDRIHRRATYKSGGAISRLSLAACTCRLEGLGCNSYRRHEPGSKPTRITIRASQMQWLPQAGRWDGRPACYAERTHNEASYSIRSVCSNRDAGLLRLRWEAGGFVWPPSSRMNIMERER